MYHWTKRKIKSKYEKVKKDVSNYLEQVIKEEKTPHDIALGFAVGAFIGILPTPGISVALALLAIFIWKRLNKVAIFAGIAVFNPFVNIPIIYYAHLLGGLLIPPVFPPDTPYGYVVHLLNTSARILAGSIITATLLSIASYFIVKRITSNYFAMKKTKKLISL